MHTILLIEDNLDILENVREFLEMEGYFVLHTSNSLTGIKMAEEHLPDLIICDVIMPEPNGLEVLNTLKSNFKTSCIPFIFCSSLSEKKQVKDALLLGATQFIVKPFDLDSLLVFVKQSLLKKSQNTLK